MINTVTKDHEIESVQTFLGAHSVPKGKTADEVGRGGGVNFPINPVHCHADVLTLIPDLGNSRRYPQPTPRSEGEIMELYLCIVYVIVSILILEYILTILGSYCGW